MAEFQGKVNDECHDNIFIGNTELYHFESIQNEGTYHITFKIPTQESAMNF